MYEGTHIVAAVQFLPQKGNIQRNLAVAEQMIFEAACKGAKIVVLPSLCFLGPWPKTISEAILGSQEKNGIYTSRLQELARKHRIYIVFGYPELHECLLYNSAAIVGPFGLVANNSAFNLLGEEYLWSAPSERIHQLAATPWGNLGVILAGDVENRQRKSYQFFNEKSKFYRKGSIDTLCVLEGISLLNQKWFELQEELGCNIIVSNYTSSCIIDRKRTVYTYGQIRSDCVVGGAILI